jgi:hypothetical protein
MKITLDQIGLEMYQYDEKLIWEFQNDYELHLSQEDLERVVAALSDELEAMNERRGYIAAPVSRNTELPDGTDGIELLPDNDEEELKALDDFDEFEECGFGD